VIFPVLAQSSTTISLKLTKLFFLQARFGYFIDPPNQSYPLVRSYKAFLLIDVLFLVVCLLCICLCPMIDWLRVNAVREVLKRLEECEVED
jgi:hypothetical protein